MAKLDHVAAAKEWVSRMAGRKLRAPFRGAKVPSLAEWLVERAAPKPLDIKPVVEPRPLPNEMASVTPLPLPKENAATRSSPPPSRGQSRSSPPPSRGQSRGRPTSRQREKEVKKPVLGQEASRLLGAPAGAKQRKKHRRAVHTSARWVPKSTEDIAFQMSGDESGYEFTGSSGDEGGAGANIVTFQDQSNVIIGAGGVLKQSARGGEVGPGTVAEQQPTLDNRLLANPAFGAHAALPRLGTAGAPSNNSVVKVTSSKKVTTPKTPKTPLSRGLSANSASTKQPTSAGGSTTVPSSRGLTSASRRSIGTAASLTSQWGMFGSPEEESVILPRFRAQRAQESGSVATMHVSHEGTMHVLSRWQNPGKGNFSGVSSGPSSPKGADEQPADRKWHLRQASLSAALARTPQSSPRAASSSKKCKAPAAEGQNEYLDFQGWGIDDDYMRSLMCKVALGRMKHINMAENRLTAAAVSLLAEAAGGRALGNLESLHLARNRLGQDGAETLARVVKEAKPPLQELDLSDNHIGDVACELLCDTLSSTCKSLLGLSLSKNNLGQHSRAGVALGTLVSTLQGLQAIDLHWNCIYGQGAAALMQGLYDNACQIKGQLWRVNLSWNRIGLRCERDHTGRQNEESQCTCESCRGCWKAVSTLAAVFSDGDVLFHLDIAYNGLCSSDCAILADGLKRNHTLFGLHVLGNSARVDDVGFIVPHGDGAQDDADIAVPQSISESVRNTPRRLRLDKLAYFNKRAEAGPVPEKAREMSIANLRTNPSLHNVAGSSAFSKQDIEFEKEWVKVHEKVQRPAEFGAAGCFDTVQGNERCCWICENWVEEQVCYIPGWSGPKEEEIETIFAFFSIDGFKRPTRLVRSSERYYERQFSVQEEKLKMMSAQANNNGADFVRALEDGDKRAPKVDGKGMYTVFKGSRMLPPSMIPVNVVFQINQQVIRPSDHMIKTQLSEKRTIMVHNEGRVASAQESILPSIPVQSGTTFTITEANVVNVGISGLRRLEHGMVSTLCLMEDPSHRGSLEVVPRRLQHDKVKAFIGAWRYETSIFKDFNRESDHILRECFDFDFGASKLDKFMSRYYKEGNAGDKVCEFLRKHYRQIIASHHGRSFKGFTLQRASAGISMLDFADVLLNRAEEKEPVRQVLEESMQPVKELATSPNNSKPNSKPSSRQGSRQGSRPSSRPGVSRPVSQGRGSTSTSQGKGSTALFRVRSAPAGKDKGYTTQVFGPNFRFADADTLFITANVMDKTKPAISDMDALPGSGLARFQYMEAFVRAALSRYHTSGEEPHPEAAMKKLLAETNAGQDHVYLRKTLHKALFCEECDIMLRNNAVMLEEAFTVYSKRLQLPGRHNQQIMSYGAWLEFLKGCGIERYGTSHLDYGTAFALGKEIRVNEYSGYRHMEINFPEFIVCVGAVVRLNGDFHLEFFSDALLEFLEEYVVQALRAAGAPQTSWQRSGDRMEEKMATLMTQVFIEADEDGSGFLTYSEFNTVVRRRHVASAFKEVGVNIDDFKLLFNRVDADKSGTVTLDELCDGLIKMKRAMAGTEKAIAYLRKLFDEADQDHSGTLSKDEFQEMFSTPAVRQKLSSIGVSSDDLEDIWAAVDAADTDDDGISPEEMISGLLSVKDADSVSTRGINFLLQVFKSADKDGSLQLNREEVTQAFYTDVVNDKLHKLGLVVPDWLNIFSAIDIDNDGELSWEELKRGMTAMWSEPSSEKKALQKHDATIVEPAEAT